MPKAPFDNEHIEVEGLEGKRCRIHYLQPGQKLPRELIGVVLGTSDIWPERLSISLRPKAGTTELKFEWILGMWITEAPIKLPEPIKAERRVY